MWIRKVEEEAAKRRKKKEEERERERETSGWRKAATGATERLSLFRVTQEGKEGNYLVDQQYEGDDDGKDGEVHPSDEACHRKPEEWCSSQSKRAKKLLGDCFYVHKR